MKKILLKLFLIWIFFLSIWAFSQTGFIPPSPQSFSFIKATNVVSENEHTGSASINIPLFTYKANKLSTDVSILYSGAGVKVDDLPNDVGMTWVVNASGVITRTVNGLIDEKATMRMNKSEAELIQRTASDCDADEEIRTACYSPFQMDTERDIFEFRFANVSGAFYLDQNFIPVFLKNDDDVKIKNILPPNETDNIKFIGFEITTKEGVKYIFGGSINYWETTASKAMPANPPGDYAVTSFFLKETEYQTGEKIYFSYEDTDLVTNAISEIHTRYLYSCCLGTGIMPNLDPELRVSVQTHYTRNKKRLKTISSSENSDKINFIYSDKADSDFKKYLSEIEYYENNEVLKKVAFNYLFESSTGVLNLQRFYLSQLSFYSRNVFDKKYQFNYDDPLSLPRRLSYNQDMYGYFNGKENESLIANFFGNTTPPSNFYPPMILQSFGNRRPYFAFATKGTLKEVIYPTGGKTKFEYESPKTKAVFKSKFGFDDDGTIVPTFGGTSTKVIENLHFDQMIPYTLITYSGNASQNHMKQAKFTIEDMDSHQLIHSDSKTYGYAPQDSIYGNISLKKDKRYLLSFTPNGSAELKLSYSHRDPIDDFGIRLKSVTHVENGQVSEYKRFYYRPIELYHVKEENMALIDMMIIPAVQYATFEEFHEGMSATVTYSAHTSTNSSPLYNSRLRERYGFVTVSIGGDNFENGGYQKSFRKDSDDPLVKIHPSPAWGSGAGSPTSGSGYFGSVNGLPNFFGVILNSLYFPAKGNRLSFSGTLNRVKYFEKKGNLIYKNKQINYQNKYNITAINPNLFVSRPFNDLTSGNCGSTSVQRISNFYISIYKNYSIDTKLQKEKKIEYIDSVPVSFYNNYDDYLAADSLNTSESAYRKIISTTDYDYTGMPFHNQLTNQKLLSPDGSVTETRYQYAQEKNNQYLIGKNMIGVPLETEVKKDGKVISKTETLYPDSQTSADAKTSGLALPYSVVSQNLLTGLMDADVRYDRYDSKGNLLQYTTKEGIPVSIVWGYNQTLPIAKVEGIIYSYLQQLSPETADIINASDIDFNAGANNDETSFLSVLQRFRTRLGNDVRFTSLVSTYTYDPLIGVRSITPPSGIREQYLYDSAGRLEKVIDVNGKILKEMKYNYKN
ncbi:RHS repeat protein [Chryseobacterium arthrosphaerae]|uniref:RHS repeat protein n=1 Tax=Chryseobacterium arthrosphaerae TaxID=651561 RepID=UPI001BAEB12C|nr:RHS repeat protein [Chryseobacterium arthrosphaerae]QUY57848.1 RHS repeat protein [Chryseobacterium arthrosphaerae]